MDGLALVCTVNLTVINRLAKILCGQAVLFSHVVYCREHLAADHENMNLAIVGQNVNELRFRRTYAGPLDDFPLVIRRVLRLVAVKQSLEQGVQCGHELLFADTPAGLYEHQ